MKESSMNQATQREATIIQTSVVGIIVNIILSIFKAAIGILSQSIAVTLDAVNNLSDALSSVITIIGSKLSNKLPDKKHPLGYGRVEYLSALIIAGIVLYAGLTAFVESFKKILHPTAADYSVVSLVIIAVAVVVKILLGRYVQSKGKAVQSNALVASGADALFDAVLSASVLASALIFLATGFSLEAYVGVVIAIFIIKSGIEMIQDTLDDILGKRPSKELADQIRDIISQEEAVRGAYDLILNNYGPDKNYGSVHIELPDTMRVEEVDVLTRRIQAAVYEQTGVVLTGVGVYSFNTQDNEVAAIRNAVQKMVLSYEWALQLHGFYADLEQKEIRFDVVMSFEMPYQQGLEILYEQMNLLYPDYQVYIAPDVDVVDL